MTSSLTFGDCRNSTGTLPTDKKFTGQRLDATGLYYYGARYYDATIGRFISADSKIPDPANPQSFNRYAYCINNPLKYTDPTGHGWWSIVSDIASIAFDIYQVATDPSWENAGYLALDVTLTCLPVIPAGVGPLAKGVSKTVRFVEKGEKVVESVDKVVEGAKIGIESERASKNTLALLKDAKVGKNGHLKVEKKVLNEIGKIESEGVDFSTLNKDVEVRRTLGKDGCRSQIVRYSDSNGKKFVIHEVYDSEGNLVHRDFDSIRIESGQYIEAVQ
jgi:RHS repeat-associated protein